MYILQWIMILELLPVVNKIDLPSADPMRVLAEVEEAIGLDCTEHNLICAKTGLGVKDLIESIIKEYLLQMVMRMHLQSFNLRLLV